MNRWAILGCPSGTTCRQRRESRTCPRQRSWMRKRRFLRRDHLADAVGATRPRCGRVPRPARKPCATRRHVRQVIRRILALLASKQCHTHSSCVKQGHPAILVLASVPVALPSAMSAQRPRNGPERSGAVTYNCHTCRILYTDSERTDRRRRP
jgi:hypothetical protein